MSCYFKINNFFPYTDNFLNSGSFLLLSMASSLLSPGDSFDAKPVRWWMKKKAKWISFAWIHFLLISLAILLVKFTGWLWRCVFSRVCAKLRLTNKILTNYRWIVFSCSMFIKLVMTGLKEFHSFFHVTSPPQRESVEVRSVHFENKFKVCITQMSFQIASARYEWIIIILKKFKWSQTCQHHWAVCSWKSSEGGWDRSWGPWGGLPTC